MAVWGLLGISDVPAGPGPHSGRQIFRGLSTESKGKVTYGVVFGAFLGW